MNHECLAFYPIKIYIILINDYWIKYLFIFSTEFEVILDETAQPREQSHAHLASNFFYDDNLLSSLSNSKSYEKRDHKAEDASSKTLDN